MVRGSAKRMSVSVAWVGAAGEEAGIALVALKIDPIFVHSRARYFLEYYFLRRVIHAGLAKVVHGSAAVARLYVSEDEGALRNFLKLIVSPLRLPLLELSNLCCKFSFVVFERLNFIMECRRFLLQLKRGILYVEYLDVQVIRRLGDLTFVPRVQGCSCEIPCITKCGKSGAQGSQRFHGGSLCSESDGVGTSDSKRGANPHPARAAGEREGV